MKLIKTVVDSNKARTALVVVLLWAFDAAGSRVADAITPVGFVGCTVKLSGRGTATGCSSPISTPNAPIPVAVAVPSSDGNPLIAIADRANNGLIVLHSDPTRLQGGDCEGAVTSCEISLPPNLCSGSAGCVMATGDLGGTPKGDLVLGSASGLVLLTGDGSGGFTATSGIPLTSNVGAVAVGDFNGDTADDIVVGQTGSVVIYTQGTGGFDNRTLGSLPLPVTLVVASDLNGDGFDDVIAATQGSDLTIFLQDRTQPGSFLSPMTLPGATELPTAILAANFTSGDEIPDLAIAFASNELAVRRGTGALGANTVSYAAPQVVPPGGSPSALVADDFNADGIQDVAASNSDSSNVALFLGDGDGNLAPQSTVCPGESGPCKVGTEPVGMVLADLDADGKDDITTINGADSSVTLLLSSRPASTPIPSATFTQSPLPTPTSTATPVTDCCTAHGTGGCSDSQCQQCVTMTDEQCANVWDGRCVDEAHGVCASTCKCATPTMLPTTTDTPMPTETPTITGTSTATNTPTMTPTGPSPLPSRTPTPTFPIPTITGSQSPSLTPTESPTPSEVPTKTRTATRTTEITATPTSVCFAAGVCLQGSSCAVDALAPPRASHWPWLLMPILYALARYGRRK